MTGHHAVLVRVLNPEQFDIGSFYDAAENIRVYTYPKMGIDEVRSLIADAHRRPDGEHHSQTLAIVSSFITEEAQQALLKTLEEPPESTKFVFVVSRDSQLLPTVLSRFHEEVVSEDISSDTENFLEFLSGRLSVRMKLIEKNGRDTVWVTDIKNGLIVYAGEHRRELSPEQIISLEYVARHLLTRGASNKFLLEHAALVLPA